MGYSIRLGLLGHVDRLVHDRSGVVGRVKELPRIG